MTVATVDNRNVSENKVRAGKRMQSHIKIPKATLVKRLLAIPGNSTLFDYRLV